MNEDQAKELGIHLREARKAKELSIRAVAEMAGVHHTLLSRIEAGRIKAPGADTLSALARALDLSLSDVYGFADYLTPKDLPSFSPYLRSKYGDLPPEAMAKLERSFSQIAKKHGYQASGPAPGEDEK